MGTSEVLGTFILVLTVGLNVSAGSSAAAFSIAAGLMCMIYALGDVSGAHFNPAVTVTLLICGEIGPVEAAQYVGTQIVGGIMASLTYCCIMQGRAFDVGPKNGSTWTQ